jgi:hypothetical protein
MIGLGLRQVSSCGALAQEHKALNSNPRTPLKKQKQQQQKQEKRKRKRRESNKCTQKHKEKT